MLLLPMRLEDVVNKTLQEEIHRTFFGPPDYSAGLSTALFPEEDHFWARRPERFTSLSPTPCLTFSVSRTSGFVATLFSSPGPLRSWNGRVRLEVCFPVPGGGGTPHHGRRVCQYLGGPRPAAAHNPFFFPFRWSLSISMNLLLSKIASPAPHILLLTVAIATLELQRVLLPLGDDPFTQEEPPKKPDPQCVCSLRKLIPMTACSSRFLFPRPPHR